MDKVRSVRFVSLWVHLGIRSVRFVSLWVCFGFAQFVLFRFGFALHFQGDRLLANFSLHPQPFCLGQKPKIRVSGENCKRIL